jgi:tripartite ATP-independent transporter DctP family solute receptor
MKKFGSEVLLLLVFLSACSPDRQSAAVASSDSSAKPISIIAAHCQTNSDSPFQDGLLYFKEAVERESKGSINVVVHCGTLGTADDELIEKTKLGACDMAVASPSFMTKIGVPEVEFFSLMFLFNSFKHWEAVLDGEVGAKLAEIMKEKTNGDLRILSYYSVGCRTYYGKKPMKSLDDFKGTKIRIAASEVQREVWVAAGAVPVVVAWGEMYQALQQNVIDGAENDYTSFVQKDHHRTTNGKFVTETNHDFATRPVFFNGKRWDSLTESQRQLIQKAVKGSERYERDSLYAKTDTCREQFLREGGTIVPFPDRQKFVALGIPVQDRVCKELGLTDLLEKIRKLADS